MAYLKLRVVGGKMMICSAYAPHSGKAFEDRRAFYSDLSTFLSGVSSRGPLLVRGDFNVRLHRRFPQEEAIMGPYVFGNPAAEYNPSSNRSLLAELCTRHR